MTSFQSFFQTNKEKMLVPAILVFALVIGVLLFFGSQHAPAQFSMRQKVSASSDLHFSFPELMDHASVEKEISKPSDISGTWQWQSEVLVLHPSQQLKAGATYNFHLPKNALKTDGQTLGRDLDFLFLVAGPSKVSVRLPAPGSTSIRSDSKITLVFDRAMIPLTQVQGDAAEALMKKWPVTITPPIAGRWRWLSSVAIEFIPTTKLIANTEYTVHVPKGIETVIGDVTETDFTWSFQTVRPEMQASFPEDGYTLAGPSTKIWMQFSDDIELASAKKQIALYRIAASGSQVAPKNMSVRPPDELPLRSVLYGMMEDEDGKMVTDKSKILIEPQNPLLFQSTYRLYVFPGLRGTEGELGSVSGSSVLFKTVGEQKVVSARYGDGSIHINLTNPVDSGSLKLGMTITPAPTVVKDAEKKDLWTVPDWEGTSIFAYPNLIARTEYTVTLGTGVRDTFGQHLKKPYTFTFKTDPLPPKVFIHSKGNFGIFERDKPPVYYVNHMNVSTLHADFAKLSLVDFLQLRSRQGNGDVYEGARDALKTKEGFQSWDMKTEKKNDVWQVLPLDIEKKRNEKLTPGLYAMDVSAPEYIDSQSKQPVISRQFFILTNLSVTLKYSGDKVLVWVTDMQSAAPVNGAAISFVALDGKTHLTGTTDKDGFFTSDFTLKDFESPANRNSPEFFVTAEKDGDLSLVSSMWNEGIQSNNFDYSTEFHTTDSGKYRVDSFLYTERPLYRAGDTVFFKGIMRLRDWNGAFSLPTKDRQAEVVVTDDSGNQVYKATIPFSDFGTFNGSFPIDAKAVLGYYTINANVVPDTDIGKKYYYDNSDAYSSFQVLAYRKPEYMVDVTAAKEEYFNHDTVEADIRGAYYFGAPMAGAAVTWQMLTYDYYFNKYTYDDGWYSFDDSAYCYRNCYQESNEIANGKGTLDESGHLKISVPVSIDQKPTSQIVSIQATITDLNNQQVGNTTNVTVHKTDTYVGIRSEDYVVTPGANAKLSLVTFKIDGTPQPNAPIKIELYSRIWNTIKKKGVDGEYYYDNEPKDTFVSAVTATSNAKGKAVASIKIPAGGEYHVVAIATDTKGRTSRAGASVYAWSNSYINWPRSNNDRLEIVTDKPTYKIGDTAKLLVKSPFQGKGVKALVTIEREQIISKQVIDVTSNALPILIPITKDHLPNAYVSVLILKPRSGETFNENGLDTGAPEFRLGYTKLSVDTESKKIALTLKTDKEKYAPGETVTVKLKTLDAGGKPVKAEVSVGTVDMSLLALSGFWTPDLVSIFYSDRGLGINTAQMLTYLEERFKPGSKGGGGGGEDGTRGDFRDTADWHPAVVTDAKGEATVTFKLPDNLTTWQILAIANTKDHTFGTVEHTFIETKHVIVRPVRPRFAVIGDDITLGAIVHNFLDAEKTFTVTLKGTGFTPRGDMLQTVTLKPGQQKKILFPVRIDPTNSVTLSFLATNGAERDEIVESIPVYPFGVPQSVSTSGIVGTGAALEKVHAPTVADASTGKLLLSVSPSLATYLPKGLEYLVKYPYGCAEQTVSSFLPSIALMQLQGFDAFHIVDKKKLTDVVTAGFERIYTFQQTDGGFGYWSDSAKSQPALTAYVLFAMNMAKTGGFHVDDGVMNRTKNYLQTVLRIQNPKDQLDNATRVYILSVLSETEAEKVQESLLATMYEKRAELPLFAQAQLATTYKNIGVNAKAESMLTEILNHARVDSRGTHFEEEESNVYGSLMNTNNRTTAIVLQSMIRIDPDHALIAPVVRYMLSVRTDGHWDTTQSTSYSLLTLVEFLKSTRELDANFTSTASLNGKEKLSWKVGKAEVLQKKDIEIALKDMLRGADNNVLLSKDGTGRLYYDLLLSYFYTPPDVIEPIEEGMSIFREMHPLTGKKTDVIVGNVYTVTLTITVPEDRNLVAVESPLPAGMEIINTDLNTEQQGFLGSMQSDFWSNDYWENGLWRFSHHEFRDDQVFLFAEYLPAGVYQYHYLVRATTPGHFHERPARVWEMYFPEIFGQSKGGWFDVKNTQ